jgi:hypothetical protein
VLVHSRPLARLLSRGRLGTPRAWAGYTCTPSRADNRSRWSSQRLLTNQLRSHSR